VERPSAHREFNIEEKYEMAEAISW